MKAIYNDFSGGLSPLERNAPLNTFFEGKEIDPFYKKDYGFLYPGWGAGSITKSNDSPQIIDHLITDICIDQSTDDAYLIDEDKMYHIPSISAYTAFDADFDGSSHYYYAISGAAVGSGAEVGTGLIVYKTKIGGAASAEKLFFIYNIAAGGAEMGMYDLSSTFDPDWLSTIPAGAASLQKAPHPYLVWNSYLWIGNGKYLSRFDGETGNNGTFTEDKYELPPGWEVTALFPTPNHIGICAWRKHTSGEIYTTKSAIFFYDGDSATHTRQIPIEDNQITAALNNNGTVYLWTTGREDAQCTLRRLTRKATGGVETGSEKIADLRHTIGSGDPDDLVAPQHKGVCSYQNGVLFKADSNANEGSFLMWYGQPSAGKPNVLTMPCGLSGTAFGGCLKIAWLNWIWASSYKTNGGDIYYLELVTPGLTSTTTAIWKPSYKDFGQKIRVNYVKYYFKPLASGDIATVTLETDYGTSNSLGTITHSADGAVTSKRFNKYILCHSFRPTITWGGGEEVFSKIIVDYDFVDNDN